MSARQAYVTDFAWRERGMVFTDLSREELLAAISRDDTRKSATELFHEPPPATEAPSPPPEVSRIEHYRAAVARVQESYRRLRLAAEAAVPAITLEREPVYER